MNVVKSVIDGPIHAVKYPKYIIINISLSQEVIPHNMIVIDTCYCVIYLGNYVI